MNIFSKLTDEEYHSKVRLAPSSIGFAQLWGIPILLGVGFMVFFYVFEFISSIF